MRTLEIFQYARAYLADLAERQKAMAQRHIQSGHYDKYAAMRAAHDATLGKIRWLDKVISAWEGSR